MRGGVTWEEAWRLDSSSVKAIVHLINENIERFKNGTPIL